MNADKRINKSDRILILIMKLCTDHERIESKEVRSLLGNPSRAQWYKMVAELTTATEFRPAILTKVDLKKKPYFCLNKDFRIKIFGEQKSL
jgi:hypothetical protein